jgi:hemerythrin-like domain-containing protein
VVTPIKRAPARSASGRSAPQRQNGVAARRHAGPASTDAIAYLKADHRQVEKLFKTFERTSSRAFRAKRKLVDDMIRELSQHTDIEEQFFYPAARRSAPGATDEVLEAMEEHHVVKWILSELTGMEPGDERFDAKVAVLTENVRHHVRQEEQVLFPELRVSMGRKELRELGSKLHGAKKLAPTRPHPRSPDEPPANLIVGVVAGAMDRARSAVKSK